MASTNAIASTPVPASASALPEGITDPNYKPPAGRLGNLTVPQQHALDKLKKELKDEGAFVPERMDDATLLRFLRARKTVENNEMKFDVAKSKKMLLNAEKWREEFGVDEIVKNFELAEPKGANRFYPQYYHKTDKEGRPVYIEQLGKLDPNKSKEEIDFDKLKKRLVLEYEKFLSERLPACSKAIGHPIETSCTIMDLKGADIGTYYRAYGFIKDAASIGQDRYPETMGKFLIVDSPSLFWIAWNAINKLLDPVTREKIKLISRADLTEYIPKQNLPKELGGTCDCEGGCEFSDAGPWNSRAAEREGEAAVFGG